VTTPCIGFWPSFGDFTSPKAENINTDVALRCCGLDLTWARMPTLEAKGQKNEETSMITTGQRVVLIHPGNVNAALYADY
jgi:hypothetical protein